MVARTAAGSAPGGFAGQLAAAPLAKLRERGTLIVGIDQDMPPFHAAGQGIDAELAQLRVDSLGAALPLPPFNAGDNINDDLRNRVWKRHDLGYGPADALMHGPVDRPLMDGRSQVSIFAPRSRERVAMARLLTQVFALDPMTRFGRLPMAVPGQSLAAWLAAAGDWSSELESVLCGHAGVAIRPLPAPRAARDGWATGLALKGDSSARAQALQAAVNSLAGSGRKAGMFTRHNAAWRGA